MQKRKTIKELSVLAYSGYMPRSRYVETAKKHHYFIVTDVAMTGDAPKDFIRYYQYGHSIKAKPKTWQLFIAKHGHKHYPNEAITEYLLNRIGETFGFNMAESKLLILGGQIRFLSRFFLTNPKSEILYHGADLYSGYLNDKDFVEEVEKQNQSTYFFTVQFTQDTFKHFFPNDWEGLMMEFVKLLVFDAIIGNNDRHFYNWGLIRNDLKMDKPRFAPIYDTARGLFWNFHEHQIKEILYNENRIESFIKKYSNGSTPKIGWDNSKYINHFDLMEKIKSLSFAINCETIQNICSRTTLEQVLSIIDSEFCNLMSYERIELIKLCLKYRHKRIVEIFNFA